MLLLYDISFFAFFVIHIVSPKTSTHFDFYKNDHQKKENVTTLLCELKRVT